MGPTLAGGAGPGRPRPAQPVRFSTAGPELDPACDIPISRAVGAARPGPAREIPTSLVVCPAWPVRFVQNIFVHSSCCFSSPLRFRGRTVLVSLRQAVSLGSHSLSTIGMRRRVWHAHILAFENRLVPWW